ncbi:MAG: T9SS type A sorting domain-containing protein [Bacteroidetes bacterium]|nr:MAG: T9SS type A sorting domain-containing protein [Bacteroidota bacterium]
MSSRNILVSLFVLCFGSGIENMHAQSANDTIIFNALGSYNFNWTYSAYTPLIDRLGRPYIYLAAKELGLVTFDISNTLNPVPVDTQTVVSLGNLKVTGVAQDSNYLLVSLGDFMGTTNAGLAIFDISNPVAPVLLDRWDSAAFNNGTSTVIWQGNYAYLGAMKKGVVILDISDKQNIQFVSQIIPDTTYGNQSYGYSSRGLFISDDTLLVADDNGGLRMIDVTNKQNPIEIGKYISSSMSMVAYPFYNHVYRIGNYAYCAVDYCGFEVVDVSNPSLMTDVSWLNPWNCTNLPPPFGSWNGSDGHTNEIAYSSSQNVLFFSGGDSQILALDPSTPAQPRIMGAWGPPNDSVGTWGTDVYGNLVALANVKTFGFPFISNVGGLQLLNWDLVSGIENNNVENLHLKIFPNPVSEKLTIELPAMEDNNYIIKIIDVFGKCFYQSKILNQKSLILNIDLPDGIYFMSVKNKRQNFTKKLIIQK